MSLMPLDLAERLQTNPHSLVSLRIYKFVTFVEISQIAAGDTNCCVGINERTEVLQIAA
jgi:hypothetical protein